MANNPSEIRQDTSSSMLDAEQLQAKASVLELQRIQERFREHLRLAEFGKDVGQAMCQGHSLPLMLHQCTEAMVRHLDGAFARIWTLNQTNNVLELQASAGQYTHIDGAHSRVPVGQFKIGLIAQERKPYLTNAVLADPRVHDQEWAGREGMVAFAGHPLLVEDRLVGVMAMFARHPLSEATLDAIASVASGIAVGIDRKRTQDCLLEKVIEIQESERRLVAEHAISCILAVSDTLNDAAPKILKAVCECLGWDVGTLWVVDRNANVLRCVQVWHTPEVEVSALEQYTRHITFPPGDGMPGRVWASKSLVWFPDLTTEPEADSARLTIAVKEGMHGAVGFPILKGTEFHGVISFFSREIRPPDEKLIEMMNSIGSQISQFIDRKVAERRLVAEHAISRILAVSDTLNDAAPKILQAVCECLGWDVGTLWVVDPKANVLRCVQVWHTPEVEVPVFEQICRESTFSQGMGLPGWVWADKALAWFSDLTTEGNPLRGPYAAKEGLHGAIAFPIKNEIEFFGVIEFFSREIRQPDEEMIEMMNSIGRHMSQFIGHRRATKELVRQEVDRRIARQIQQGHLPRAMPRFAGYNIGGRSTSADEVGGDWFDYIPLLVEGVECLDVLVGDVSGHGIASALLAGQTRAYLRAFALTCSDVGKILTLTNHRLAADLVTEHFVTLLLVQLDPRNRSLVYASAGHCPGYVLDHQGQIKSVLASTGGLLGIDSASEFPTGPSLTLEPGDLVFLYTDGIVEAGSSTGTPFGLERTLAVVRAHQQETPDEILEALFDAVGGSEDHRDDDLTAVIIQVKGVAGP